MVLVVVILGLPVLGLFTYNLIVRSQVRRMNRLLKKRLERNTNQIVSLELVDKELNHLGENINRCLKAEETLRLKVVEEENDFRDMIANISHDLRTPLTAIKGYLQLIQKNEQDSEQLNKLQIAMNRTEDLGNLIEHFYEYAYLFDVKPEVHMERINLSNLVTECFAGVIPMLDEKNLDLDVEEAAILISGDKEMTARVVQNLIRNCLTHAKDKIIVKYTVGEQITMHFMNTVEHPENIDTEKLFERFYVANKERKTTGLGLSIVKILMEQSNGSVSAVVDKDWIDIQVVFQRYQPMEI